MITVQVGDCTIDIIPIVKGLVSEKDKVAEALSSKNYDCTAVPLGIEDIEAIRKRAEIEGEFEPSDLDSVYSYFLKQVGMIDMPDPASTYLIDECTSKDVPIVPLDMTDEDYSKMYCENVSTIEFLKEKRILKKAMKKKFDLSSGETFVKQWDELVNEIKGYRKVSLIREQYMADQIKDIAKYRKSVLVLMDLERTDGVVSHL